MSREKTMNVNDYYTTESKWLKGDDLPEGREVKVMIDGIEEVEFGQNEPKKLAIKFKDKKKGVVLNKTNAVRIMSVYGSDSSQWVGKEIFLFSEPTDFNGQSVKAVRVRVPLPTHVESETEVNW